MIFLMDYGRKITLILFATILGFLPLVAASFFFLNRSLNEQTRVIETFASQSVLAEQLRDTFALQSAEIPRYILSGDQALLRAFEAEHKNFFNEADRMVAIDGDTHVRDLITHIETVARHLHGLAGPGIQMREEGESAEAVDRYFREKAGADMRSLMTSLDEVVRLENENLQNAKSHARKTSRWMLAGLGLLALLAFGLALFMLRAVVQILAQKDLVEKAQAVLLDDQKRMAQARKEAVETVAHDLKNPIATIAMSLELAGETATAETQDCLAIARRSVDSARALVDNILDHAKIEAGKLVLEPVPVRMDSLLGDLFLRFSLLAKEREILLETNIQIRQLFSKCDAFRIEQALSNILGNAIKFTPKGGKVTLAAREAENQLVISVKDEGQGIAQEELPHVFERFWQARATAKQGNGLGLAIVKAIVEAHEGKVWVKSSLGKGAEFFLSLPLAGR